MRLSKFARCLAILGLSSAGMQAVSFGANPTIYFTGDTVGGPGPTQLTNTAGPTTGDNQGIFAPTGGTNIVAVTGSSGSYVPGYVTSIANSGTGTSGDPSDFVRINGFIPATDSVLVALNLDNNGTALNPVTDGSLIGTIIGDINTNNPGFGGTLASTVPANLAPQFPGYDVLLTFPSSFVSGLTPGSPAQFDFGFDFGGYTNGSVTNVTVTDIGVVPEPACLGLLSVVGLALLPRYRRREA